VALIVIVVVAEGCVLLVPRRRQRLVVSLLAIDVFILILRYFLKFRSDSKQQQLSTASTCVVVVPVGTDEYLWDSMFLMLVFVTLFVVELV
jgi:hypothetical protein